MAGRNVARQDRMVVCKMFMKIKKDESEGRPKNQMVENEEGRI